MGYDVYVLSNWIEFLQTQVLETKLNILRAIVFKRTKCKWRKVIINVNVLCYSFFLISWSKVSIMAICVLGIETNYFLAQFDIFLNFKESMFPAFTVTCLCLFNGFFARYMVNFIFTYFINAKRWILTEI